MRMMKVLFPLTTAIAALFLARLAAAQGVSLPVTRWDVETSERVAPFDFPVFRGETHILEPRYLSYRRPMELNTAWEVVLRYRSPDMQEGFYYAKTGEVINATNGLTRFVFGPNDVGHTNAYAYTVAVKTALGDNVRGFGKIAIRGIVDGTATNMPAAVTTPFDWASVEHINVLSAPFVSEPDLLMLWEAISAASNRVTVLTQMGGDVSGPSTNASVIGLAGVPLSILSPGQAEDGFGIKYDHASGSLLLGPVASESGGSTSNLLVVVGTNSRFAVEGQSAGFYRTIRPGFLPSLVANVGGQEVAFFDLLGITLRQGTISLLNTNLQANIRHFDGSVVNPAAAWSGDPQTGKYRFGYQGGSAEGFATGGQTIWYWTADGIHLAPGKSLFADGVVAQAEIDPRALQTSAWYVAYTDLGPYTVALSNATPVVFCSNGLYSASYDEDRLWLQTQGQISPDQLTWSPYEGEAVADPVWYRVFAYDSLPGSDTNAPGPATISNIVIHSWARPQVVGRVSDLAGQTLRVDWPAAARDTASKDYVDQVGATRWAQHAATQDVRMAGHRLWFDARWSMIARGAYTAVSYDLDMSVATNRWRLDYDGQPILTVQLGGLVPLPVSDFMVLTGETDTVWYMRVPTNAVTAAPRPQWSSNLVNWADIETYTGSYPISTNDAYTLWWTNDFSSSAYFRAVQVGTSVVERVVANRPLDVGTHGLVINGFPMLHAPDSVRVLPSATNVVIQRTDGPQVALVVTNPTAVISFAPQWSTSEIGRVRMDLIRGTNLVALNTNSISGTITNSAVSTIEFDKQWSRTLWRVVRQW